MAKRHSAWRATPFGPTPYGDDVQDAANPSPIQFDPRTHLPQLDKFISSSHRYAQRQRIDLENADRPLRVLHGVNIQAIRHAAAFVHLRKSEFTTEAGVCARAALEHAVTSQWCHYTGEGIDRLANTMAADHKAFATAAGDWLDDDSLRKRAAALPKAGTPQLPPFSGKSGILGTIADADTFLKLSYKVLSQPTHVTTAAGLGYIRQVQGGGYELSTKPAEARYDYPSTYTAAASAMLASWVQAELTGDKTRLRTLDALSDRLGLPVSLEEHIDAKWRGGES